MSKRTASEVDAQAFKDIFNPLFNEKWIARKKSKNQFLQEVAEAHEKRTGKKITLTYGHLRKWRTGTYPTSYLLDIANVLDVEPAIFSPYRGNIIHFRCPYCGTPLDIKA